MAELPDEQLGRRSTPGASGSEPIADAAYTQLIVNEGGGGGASLEHTHAQLYALPFVPPAVARERERVGAYRERTAGGGPAQRYPRRGGAPRRAPGRDRRGGGADLPLGVALARSSCGCSRAAPRRASRATTPAPRCSARALRALARRFDGPPELNLWVRTAPRGVEHFHWHIDIAPRLTVKAGLRARHRGRDQHLPSRAGGGRPSQADRRVGCPRWPPSPARSPASSPTARRTGSPTGGSPSASESTSAPPARRSPTYRRGCRSRPRSTGSRSGPGEGGPGCRRPQRARDPTDRSSSSATSPTAARGGRPDRLPGERRLHRRARRGQPGLADRPQRRCDRPLARRGGDGGQRHPRLGPAPPAGGVGGDRGARGAKRRSGAGVDGHFTLVALDALEGFGDDVFLEVKLWSQRARELASESLYEVGGEEDQDTDGDG